MSGLFGAIFSFFRSSHPFSVVSQQASAGFSLFLRIIFSIFGNFIAAISFIIGVSFFIIPLYFLYFLLS